MNKIELRVYNNLRSRVKKAIKRKRIKHRDLICNFGCSISELIKYIESKFKSEMSWNNYGLFGWHLDHIKPLKSFNLKNKDEFLAAIHYSNIQPLWAAENLSKGCKYKEMEEIVIIPY